MEFLLHDEAEIIAVFMYLQMYMSVKRFLVSAKMVGTVSTLSAVMFVDVLVAGLASTVKQVSTVIFNTGYLAMYN